ncbi:MAG: class I SAM-dependent methyltransferase [Isosphaeraceae bacterium]
MIETWSRGVADDNMAEEFLLDRIGRLVRRHPWWWARTRLVPALLDRAGVRPPARLLDAGCGWGITLDCLEILGFRAEGMDISRKALELIDRPDRRLIEADLVAGWSGVLDRYDAVLALDVIEHLDDDRGAVTRLGELLNPGGVMVVSVPARPDLFTQYDELQGHRRRYEPASLRSAFDDSGLVVERVLWWGQWMVPILRRQRARPRPLNGSASDLFASYLKLPPWPGPWLLRLAYIAEQPSMLGGNLTTGTSLFAVARKPEA